MTEVESSYSQLADAIFLSPDAPRGVKLNLRTPTSFKQNGEYVVFPATDLIMNSLVQKWNAFTDGMTLEEDDLKGKLGRMCKISQYRLHSARFGVEQTSITGFAGSMVLRFHANDMQRRLLGLLFSFAPYASLGIKNALGMGCVEAELI